MALLVYTSQFRYDGPDRLDITRGSKHADPKIREAFAPSWRLLNWGKAQLANAKTDAARDWAWMSYEARYTEAMRLSYKKHRTTWDGVLSRDRVVLVCFCAKNPHQCHRRVLADILQKLGATDVGEVPVDHQFE
jgi:uncharacterized protein YeaO (DUF488 family)